MNIATTTAAQLMTTQLITIEPHESLRRAAAMITQHRVHCLLVLASEPHRSLGVIAVKDIVQVLCEGDAHLLDQLRVSDAATTPAFTVQKDFVIQDCIRLMRMAGVRSVPVLDGVIPVGVLSFTDVVRAVAVGA
jgi:predicted transcriptional regulator